MGFQDQSGGVSRGTPEHQWKAQEGTRQHLKHEGQEIHAFKQEVLISKRDRDKIAEKLKVATEELEVLRNSVTQFMTTKERAEEMLRQSEVQRTGA